MLYSVDRFEEEIAVLVDESGTSHEVPRTALPVSCRPGVMVREQNGCFTIDESATEERRAYVAHLQNTVCKRRRR
ncbi:MAG: DUF3006 domain-containing protein [Ruminococcaceae bacterium]|nr:DUF3006 domain-containing protein [Oscillospiraceae bacterium]